MEDRGRSGHFFIANKNDTMVPALRYGDVARMEPCEVSSLRVGDVICFYRAIDHAWISRVVAIGPEGIRARGDNDTLGFYRVIHPEDLIGRVIRAYRGSRIIPMRNGLPGRLTGLGCLAFRTLAPALYPLLGPVYRGLSRKGVLRRWIPRELAPRVVGFERKKGVEYQLFTGRRVVGRRLPDGKWLIQPPFRLFVEESALPGV